MVDGARREFLRLGAGAAALGAMPASIARAMELPARRRSGTIEDVEHVVVFMQENRSFDHYFGHLRGVRDYNDRFAVLRAERRFAGRVETGRPSTSDPAARQVVLDEAVRA
jgi:phospholipase C